MQVSRGPAEFVRLLVVESDPVQRRLLADGLDVAAGFGADLVYAGEANDALGLARGAAFDLILVDVETVGGFDVISHIARVAPRAVLLATTRVGTVSAAVEALRAGADDFLVKPYAVARLAERYADCLTRRRHVEPAEPSAPQAAETDFEGFIGASPVMTGVYEQIRRVAPSKAPVFITGESGTGKELCAEAVHTRSGRGDKPFVAINCSAIPSDLIESEIFGHVRGAFTGAIEDRPGAAELADGGTLFLDEIGEMDLGLQAKLLRFIQTGIVRRVGGTSSRAVDVRFVCATNRDPVAEIRAGRFREDLFYRLHVLPIELPPLRARGEDIRTLARGFLARFAAEEGKEFLGFEETVERRLQRYSWPGNVRQLENVIRQVVVLHDGVHVGIDMLPPLIEDETNRPATFLAWRSQPDPAPTAIVPFWKQEQGIIEQALAVFDGNISRAAAALEIAPSTIYRKRQSWATRNAN